MPRWSVQAVGNLGISLVKALSLCTVSTGSFINLASQLSFRHFLFTALAFQTPVYSQALSAITNLLGLGFYTVSTVPMNATNLIKE
jgi:hypothetical protein